MVQDEETRDGAGGAVRGKMRVLLFGSLALNLLVVGVLAGAALTGGWRHDHRGPGLESAGGPMTRALTHDDRRAIARQMREVYLNGKPGRDAQRASFDALLSELRAVPFERAAVEGHMARMRGMLSERLELGQTLLLDRLEAMTPAQRAEFADRLEKGRREFKGPER